MSPPVATPAPIVSFAPLVFAAALCTAAAGPAAPWPQFRGPGGGGVAREGAAPPPEPGAANLAWKVPLPPGHSSPVVAGGAVFITGLEGGRLVTLGLDRTDGGLRWRAEAPEVRLEKVHQTSSPAAPSPLWHGGRLFVYFGSFGLLAYDAATGEELWRHELPTPESLYGTACSPIAYGENVILVLDDDADLPDSKLSRSRVAAFRLADGGLAWETPRPSLRSGWSTPAIWARGGGAGDELVVLGSGRATGYEAATGAERWTLGGFSRETIAVPVVGGGRCYIASAQLGGGADKVIDPEPFWRALLGFDSDGDGAVAADEMTEHFTYPLRPELPPGHPGYGIPLPRDPVARRERQRGIFGWVDKDRDGRWTEAEWRDHLAAKGGRPMLVAVEPGGVGDIGDSHVAWELNRSVPEVPSPLFYEGRIYLARNGGLLAAVDAASGEQIYRERLPGAGGGYSASPVCAGGLLYLLSEGGQLSVVEAGAEFAARHRFDLGERASVTPAIDADTLYVRTEGHLWAFRVPG